MIRAVVAMLIVFAAVAANVGHAHTEALFRQVDFEQHLDAALPRDARFLDEHGRAVTLSDYYGGAPLVVVLGYLDCPNLCSLVLVGAAEALAGTGLAPRQDYRALFVSIEPRDSPAQARAKRAEVLPGARGAGWHFLTGSAPSIAALARAVGFRYVYDAEIHEYAHPAGIVVMTPEGRISSYLFGVRFPPWQLRLALAQAASGRSGSLADRLLLLCFHYDPQAGRYNVAIMNGLRAGSLVFLVAGGIFLWRFRRSRR
jgi:protein SCO1/2